MIAYFLDSWRGRHEPGFVVRTRRGLRHYTRYLATGDRGELDASVRELSQARRRVTVPQRRRRVIGANNLAVALLSRFDRDGNPDDLNRAIRTLSHEASQRLGDRSAEAARLVALLDALKKKDDVAKTRSRPRAPRRPPPGPLRQLLEGRGPEPDVDSVGTSVEPSPPAAGIAAVQGQLGAMTSLPVPARVQALRSSGYAMASAAGPAAGYRDLAAAVRLLPRAVAGHHFAVDPADITDAATHAKLLTEGTGLAADAAACAIAAGHSVRALELFEAGRALQWDALLHRSIRAETYVVQPRLARRIERVVASEHRHARTPTNPDMIQARRWSFLDAGADAWEIAGRTWQRLRWHIAARTAKTQLPATLRVPIYKHDLRPAASEGPVVVVVVSRFGCYALIVRSDRDVPDVVELPDLDAESAGKRADRYLRALNGGPGPTRERAVDDTILWLWRTLASPVLRVLAPSEEEGRLPRVWWCPSGVLGALPLHAATAPWFGPGNPTASLPARVVSSYTPTLRVLVWARAARDLRGANRRTGAQDVRRFLLVSVSDRPGDVAIPAAARTRDQLRYLIPPHRLSLLEGPDATWQSVTGSLGTHPWVHFDCHGVQDLDHPSRTGLVLQDRTLTVADLVGIRTGRPEFAFLAACTTARPHALMPDEVVSLTSALQYGGYQHVIGTQTTISDRASARVAETLYRSLARDGRIRPDNSARLLHEATLKERAARPHHPSGWVPFVHIGV
ncbi:CHAT domain-containing protein [Streptomyces sp. SID3343]|uniref:CHAT domain-containing protein n=1 Tax=Streptomyces sp. SID3343 TaxID=2690260 RepID=UPI001371954C